MNEEWTVERHLLGKPPEVVALYHRFIELAQACGPFTYAVSKSAITLKGTRREFAGASLGNQALSGYLDLPRRREDSRITRSDPYTKRLWVHHFRVDSPATSTSSSPAVLVRPINEAARSPQRATWPAPR